MSDETPAQQLLREWHEALEACERFEHGELDETGKARLEELRFHEARLAERVRAQGLIPEQVEPRSGLWAPLPLHEPPACPPVPEVPLDSFSEPSGAPPKVVPFERVLHEVSRLYDRRVRARRAWRWIAHFEELQLTPAAARLLAAAYDDLERPASAQVVRARHHLPPRPEPPPPYFAVCEVQPPFLPAEVDGLTAPQRRIVEVLASSSPAYQRVPVIVEDALGTFDGPTLERAIEELQRPRPYPLLERDPAHPQELRLRLTELAMEMVEQKPGCPPRVHGAFFPNLLVNGCAEPFAFPTHHLAEVIEAVKLVAVFAQVDEVSLFSKFQGPDFGEGFQCNFPRNLYWQGSGLLDFVLRVRWHGLTAFVLDLFPPGVTAAEVQAVIEEARTSGALDGVTSVGCAGDSVRVELEHAAFGRAVLRLLDRRGLYRRAWKLSLTHESSGGQPTASWLGHLLSLFYERTRTLVASRLWAEEDGLTARLRDLDELERAHASRAQVDRVLDVALDGAEAVWALTRLGTPEFAQHRAFGSVDVGGLAPFSEAAAKSIVKGGASRLGSAALERRDLLDRLETLRELRAPDRLRAQVFEALDRIASKYARRERRTVVTSLASCALELSLE